jgi:hypothetical protein
MRLNGDTEMYNAAVYTCLFIMCVPSFGIASLQREVDHFLKAYEAVLNFQTAKRFYMLL